MNQIKDNNTEKVMNEEAMESGVFETSSVHPGPREGACTNNVSDSCRALLEKQFSSGCYLFLCIFQTVCTAVVVDGIDFYPIGIVVMILLCVSMWMTFSYAKKGKLTANFNHMKLVSGSMKAMRIINRILLTLVVVVGSVVSIFCFFSSTDTVAELLRELIFEITSKQPESIDTALRSFGLLGVVGGIITLVLTILAVICLCINDRFYRSCINGSQAIRDILHTGNADLKKLKKLKNWLLTYGILSCLGFISIFTGALLIVAYVFVDKLIDDIELISA